MDAAEPLYFWHIPKTAGMSLWAFLEQCAGSERVYAAHLLPDLVHDAAAGRLGGAGVYRGHFADAPLRLVPEPLRVVTVLRDPVARSLSHLAHVHRAADHPLHERVRAHGDDVDRLLGDRVLRRMLQDYQCRYLGTPFVPRRGPEDEETWVVPPSDALRAQMHFEMAPLPPRRRLVPAALARLARIPLVGVVERLPDLLRTVARDRGWPVPQSTPHVNTRSSAQEHLRPELLTPGQLASLRSLTRGDEVLWQVARARAAVTARQAA